MKSRESAFRFRVFLDRVEQLFSDVKIKRILRHAVQMIRTELSFSREKEANLASATSLYKKQAQRQVSKLKM